jgi:hypothetical protein
VSLFDRLASRRQTLLAQRLNAQLARTIVYDCEPSLLRSQASIARNDHLCTNSRPLSASGVDDRSRLFDRILSQRFWVHLQSCQSLSHFKSHGKPFRDFASSRIAATPWLQKSLSPHGHVGNSFHHIARFEQRHASRMEQHAPECRSYPTEQSQSMRIASCHRVFNQQD